MPRSFLCSRSQSIILNSLSSFARRNINLREGAYQPHRERIRLYAFHRCNRQRLSNLGARHTSGVTQNRPMKVT